MVLFIAAIAAGSIGMLFLMVMLYQLSALKKQMLKVKTRLSQNSISLRLIYKTLENMDKKIQGQAHAYYAQQDNHAIEKDYERAKKLLKQGVQENISDLHMGDLTSEEIELLANLIKTEEMA